jgi:hypothetical protein
MDQGNALGCSRTETTGLIGVQIVDRRDNKHTWTFLIETIDMFSHSSTIEDRQERCYEVRWIGDVYSEFKAFKLRSLSCLRKVRWSQTRAKTSEILDHVMLSALYHCALTTRVYYIYHVPSLCSTSRFIPFLSSCARNHKTSDRTSLSHTTCPASFPSSYFSLLFLSWFDVFSFRRLEHGPESSPAARESGGDAINSCLPLTYDRQRLLYSLASRTHDTCVQLK